MSPSRKATKKRNKRNKKTKKAAKDQSGVTKRSLYHGWLPKYPQIHKKFLTDHVHASAPDPSSGYTHQPAVDAFSDAINANQVMKDLFDLIFKQVNKDRKWQPSDAGYRVRDFEHLLRVLDKIVIAPPKFYKLQIGSETIGEPIAYDLFRMTEFNVAMKTLLNSWAEYLESDGSNTTLNNGAEGWYSDAGMALLQSGLGKWSFEQTYEVDPEAEEHLFKSWDAFFTRKFNSETQGVRPIYGQGRLPLIYNACESTIFRTAKNVRLHDTFWLKGQNYSLYDMFGGKRYPDFSGLANEFVGSSVYQAFLAPNDYHRWHSPVKGNVTKTKLLEGTYYAVLPDDGAPAYDPDLKPGDPHGAMVRSQPWLSVAATRAAFIIEPTDPILPVRKVCFIAIGMVEVSSCEIDPEAVEGKSVEVGQGLGTFHFGGSSHVVIIQPEEGYEVIFQDQNDTPMRPGQHRWINSVIGQVKRKKGGVR